MDLPYRQRTITWAPPSATSNGGVPAKRPRILFLSCHLPWPPVSGGRRRELELIKRLAAHFHIHLVVVSKTPGHDISSARLLAGSCDEVEVFAAEPATAPDAAHQPAQLARHRSQPATKRVAEILARGTVDLVHVEGFYLMQHVPESAEVPVLLVEQNIEFDLAHQRATVGCDSDTRFDLFSRYVRTRAAEIESWRAATRLATVTPEDRDVIEAELTGARVAVVPDGADHLPGHRDGEHRVERPRAPLIALLANFAYAPNIDAAQHLCRDILPPVRAAVPNVHTWLVGNAPPPEVRDLAADAVQVTGRVPDVLPYLDAADVMVCPLRIGGGIKVKTIEALARGKAIVSTPIGAQGLNAQARHALLIEEQPHAFAEAVALLVNDPDRRVQLERRAMRAAARLPTWNDAADALADVYDELLEQSPRPEAQPVRIAAGRSV
jgi:polysaccharide biosynthesis protein PslH